MKTTIYAFLIAISTLLTACEKESASVGVIGGADGPTSILVSGPVFPMGLVLLGAIAVIAIIVAVLVSKK